MNDITNKPIFAKRLSLNVVPKTLFISKLILFIVLPIIPIITAPKVVK